MGSRLLLPMERSRRSSILLLGARERQHCRRGDGVSGDREAGIARAGGRRDCGLQLTHTGCRREPHRSSTEAAPTRASPRTGFLNASAIIAARGPPHPSPRGPRRRIRRRAPRGADPHPGEANDAAAPRSRRDVFGEPGSGDFRGVAASFAPAGSRLTLGSGGAGPAAPLGPWPASARSWKLGRLRAGAARRARNLALRTRARRGPTRGDGHARERDGTMRRVDDDGGPGPCL